jgi:hypothetical protein
MEQKVGNNSYRMAVGIAVLGVLLLTWLNLAVGLIGSEDNPANLMFVGLLAVGAASSLVVRVRAGGMAKVLFAMALMQFIIAAIALIAGLGSEGANWPQVIIVLNGFFALVWLVSGLLFRKAARVHILGGSSGASSSF